MRVTVAQILMIAISLSNAMCLIIPVLALAIYWQVAQDSPTDRRKIDVRSHR
jgi:hypothetical protein